MTDWTDLDTADDLGPEAIVTTSTMEALYNNPQAMAEGSPGAPRVQSAAIDWSTVSSEIGQSQIKSSTGTVSISTQDIPSSGFRDLPGGQYGFLCEARVQRGSTGSGTPEASGYIEHRGSKYLKNTSSPVDSGWYGPEVWLSAVSGSAAVTTTSARQRYVQSSPPYDHGDGEVLGYVYALVDPSGFVSGMYIAEDPPWYGRTRHAPIRQYAGKDGKVYGRFMRPRVSVQDLLAGRVTLEEFKRHCGECEMVDEEVTTETKMRGMDEHPHPFMRSQEGRTVVLLDPVADLTGRLTQMMLAGESVPDLFARDYLRVDNGGLRRKGPPGVSIHAAKWRRG